MLLTHKQIYQYICDINILIDNPVWEENSLCMTYPFQNVTIDSSDFMFLIILIGSDRSKKGN